MVARPPFALTKNNFLTEKLLCFVSIPTEYNDLSAVLYIIQQIKSFKEASGHFVRKLVRKKT